MAYMAASRRSHSTSGRSHLKRCGSDGTKRTTIALRPFCVLECQNACPRSPSANSTKGVRLCPALIWCQPNNSKIERWRDGAAAPSRALKSR
ncbi:hypothetical protein K439DRAFT_803353 [Ramaria rubella]|nr:hypothetical protein K439DRAFT_803353 [Ramaria rubella]